MVSPHDLAVDLNGSPLEPLLTAQTRAGQVLGEEASRLAQDLLGGSALLQDDFLERVSADLVDDAVLRLGALVTDYAVEAARGLSEAFTAPYKQMVAEQVEATHQILAALGPIVDDAYQSVAIIVEESCRFLQSLPTFQLEQLDALIDAAPEAAAWPARRWSERDILRLLFLSRGALALWMWTVVVGLAVFTDDEQLTGHLLLLAALIAACEKALDHFDDHRP